MILIKQTPYVKINAKKVWLEFAKMVFHMVLSFFQNILEFLSQFILQMKSYFDTMKNLKPKIFHQAQTLYKLVYKNTKINTNQNDQRSIRSQVIFIIITNL